MREVSACDFCGEQAAGVFEVLPAGIDGDGRRMVLCDHCETTLADVVDPLLTALDGDHGEPVIAEAESVGATAGADDGTDEAGATEDAGTGAETETKTETQTEAAEPGADEDTHEAGGRTLSSRNGTPKGYSKVMKFLEGREFPMEREEAESMVAEAYEMDPRAVAAAIDHAAKHGRVRVASGKLFR